MDCEEECIEWFRHEERCVDYFDYLVGHDNNYADEDVESLDDGQPSEMDEWLDFDPDC